MTQIKRSAGQSAVASAAYRSGERLYSEYYGVVCSEILLPGHAPPEYADRQTLWNAVENAESGKKAQLAYSFDIALQNEFSLEENIALARQFLLDEFVSRGMIVEYAVHLPDKEGGIGNPHFHVMCPIRPLKENGEWDAKQHREYLVDESGAPILDDAGHRKFNAIPTTDWGSPETLEHWRQAWAERCNTRFAEKELDVRIDHRSYERQGIDQIPTVHEGPAVRQMETYNRKYAPCRTEADWLCANPDAQDAYMEDPQCGDGFTISSFRELLFAMKTCSEKEHLSHMNPAVPVLFISGKEDAVGNFGKGVQSAAGLFKDEQFTDVTVKLFEGMRHDIFREKDCRDVFEYIYRWIWERLS